MVGLRGSSARVSWKHLLFGALAVEAALWAAQLLLEIPRWTDLGLLRDSANRRCGGHGREVFVKSRLRSECVGSELGSLGVNIGMCGDDAKLTDVCGIVECGYGDEQSGAVGNGGGTGQGEHDECYWADRPMHHTSEEYEGGSTRESECGVKRRDEVRSVRRGVRGISSVMSVLVVMAAGTDIADEVDIDVLDAEVEKTEDAEGDQPERRVKETNREERDTTTAMQEDPTDDNLIQRLQALGASTRERKVGRGVRQKGAKQSLRGEECASALRFSSSKEPYDQSGLLSFCQNHERLTCCDRKDTEEIRRDVGKILVATDTTTNLECRDFLLRAKCAKCDAEVGIGLALTSDGVPKVCSSFCHDWYEACKNEFFSPRDGAIGDGKDIMPCATNDNLMPCAKLSSLTKTADELCARFGLAIAAGDCFDGESSAARYATGKKPPRVFKRWTTAADANQHIGFVERFTGIRMPSLGELRQRLFGGVQVQLVLAYTFTLFAVVTILLSSDVTAQALSDIRRRYTAVWEWVSAFALRVWRLYSPTNRRIADNPH